MSWTRCYLQVARRTCVCESTWLKPADHQFWGQDNSRLFSALYAPPRTPQDFMSTYVKCSVGSLDRELLKVVLKELLPSATFDDGVVAFAAQNNSTTSRPPLKALFDIARNKVRAKRDGEQRLKELPRDIEHWKGLYKDSVSLLRGGVDALDGFVDLSVDGRPLLRPAALDGNRRVVGCTPLPETHGACSGQRFVGLKVRRGVAGKALDHLLGLAATTPRIARPRREENHSQGTSASGSASSPRTGPCRRAGPSTGLVMWMGSGGGAGSGRTRRSCVWSGWKASMLVSTRGTKPSRNAPPRGPFMCGVRCRPDRGGTEATSSAAPRTMSTGTRAVTTSSGAPSADTRWPRATVTFTLSPGRFRSNALNRSASPLMLLPSTSTMTSPSVKRAVWRPRSAPDARQSCGAVRRRG